MRKQSERRRKMNRKRRKRTRKRRKRTRMMKRRYRKGKIYLLKTFTPRTFLLKLIHLLSPKLGLCCASILKETQRNSHSH